MTSDAMASGEEDIEPTSASKPLARRLLVYAINALLVLIILGLLLATWWPAIYSSPWGQTHLK